MTITSTEKGSISKDNEQEEDIMDFVGGEGPWQRWLFVIIITCSIPDAGHNFAMSFLAPNLDHWCARTPSFINVSVEEWKAVALPPDDKHCSRYKYLNISDFHQDHIKHNFAKTETIACDSWEYDNSVYHSTVLSEWNLVCDREWLVSMSKSIFLAGYFISSTLFGYLADKYGRRLIIAVCNVIAVVSAVICIFSTSFLMFAICRFFISVGVTAVDNIAFVLTMEIISPKYRSDYGIGTYFGWSMGYLILPLFAWILRDWLWIHIVITLPSFFLLSTWWLLPESPRWLLSQGRHEEALEVLSKAAKANGVDITETDAKLKEIILKLEKEHESDHSNANVLQLLKPGMWQKTVIVLYLWSVIAFVYYGISYNTNELAGDPFLNFAAYGIIEVPAYILLIFVMRSKGRRNPLAISLAASGISCLLIYPIPEDPWWASTAVSLFGKFCIACSFSIVYVCTAEIFPTTVRNVGLGAASVSARIGSIIAPFVRELGKATHPVVPQIIFGILAATGGCLALLLPEMTNRSVPDTLKEAAELSRKTAPKTKTETSLALKNLNKCKERI